MAAARYYAISIAVLLATALLWAALFAFRVEIGVTRASSGDRAQQLRPRAVAETGLAARARASASPQARSAASAGVAQAFPRLDDSPIASERAYARLCATAGPPCGGFDAELREFSEGVQSIAALRRHGRALLFYDEFLPAGLSQHWTKRRLALWLGMLLRRAVFVAHCDDTGRFARLPPCAGGEGVPPPSKFDMEAHFGLRGGGSLAWTREVADAVRAANGERGRAEVLLDIRNWTLASGGSVASAAPLLGARLFFNVERVKALQLQLFREHGVLRNASAALRSVHCLATCAGFAVSRPSAELAARIAPVEARMRRADSRIGLHVRTMRADVPACFPDSTPPDADAIDRAFGGDACMRSFDHWRFKLVPLRQFETRARCSRAHLADVTPLTGWLRCAGAGLPRALAARGGRAATASRRVVTSVFLATDAPALQRYAARPGALGVRDGSAFLLALNGSDAIAHTHPRGKAATARSSSGYREAHARGAADWYLLTLSDAILAPIESAFTGSGCLVRADAENCSLLSPRISDFRARRGLGACALSACFPGVRCDECQFKPEYMGRVQLRRRSADNS